MKGVAIGNGYITPDLIYESYPSYTRNVGKISEERAKWLQPKAEICAHLMRINNKRLGHGPRSVCEIMYDQTINDDKGTKLFYEYDVNRPGTFEYVEHYCNLLNDPNMA